MAVGCNCVIRHMPAMATGPVLFVSGQVKRGASARCYCKEIASHNIAMVGILVHGDNHLIVRGPLPDRETALDLVRHWSLIQIGATTPPALDRWQIVTRELRENLEWAVVMPGEGDVSSAVTELLGELSTRRITIHRYRVGPD
jgi:hypothetical protein